MKTPSKRRAGSAQGNHIYFPQRLRDAIPGPELPGCARCLILSSIDGGLYGRRIRLKFRAEESGKLKGTFDIGVDLQADAARALAATLLDLAERTEQFSG